MASFLLIKKVNSVSSLFLSTRHQNLSILTPLFHFSTSTQTQPKDDLPFIAQYLMSSFGFSKDRALMVSTRSDLAAIKTPARPESVVSFLKGIGLTDIQIKHAVSRAPRLLSHSVSKTLEPCAHEIIAAGFTHKILLQLIQFNVMVLTHKKMLSRLQFWRNFVGNNEETLLKLLTNWMFLSSDIDEKVNPRIQLLREYGLSDQQISLTIKKCPSVVTVPEEKMKSKMKFLIEKAGLNQKFIIDHPGLLAYSLEKRLVPRHHVLSILKSKGQKKKCDLYGVVSICEADFVERFIEPYEKQVPDLANAYNALLQKKGL